ncbi:hypothetical protein PENTCL1PPCAC_6844 [Pristionchus entomophagus]|uniref:Uncharacterized protein n=1 Tax=Pristionchus entomophagus TaxID=358040 RepID=A0AAV5SWP5_9BILA|nr:hypothetical protein PENTCL1PPCAC_6844 [Pristionchus entomophagus]
MDRVSGEEIKDQRSTTNTRSIHDCLHSYWLYIDRFPKRMNVGFPLDQTRVFPGYVEDAARIAAKVLKNQPNKSFSRLCRRLPRGLQQKS